MAHLTAPHNPNHIESKEKNLHSLVYEPILMHQLMDGTREILDFGKVVTGFLRVSFIVGGGRGGGRSPRRGLGRRRRRFLPGHVQVATAALGQQHQRMRRRSVPVESSGLRNQDILDVLVAGFEVSTFPRVVAALGISVVGIHREESAATTNNKQEKAIIRNI